MPRRPIYCGFLLFAVAGAPEAAQIRWSATAPAILVSQSIAWGSASEGGCSCSQWMQELLQFYCQNLLKCPEISAVPFLRPACNVSFTVYRVIDVCYR